MSGNRKGNGGENPATESDPAGVDVHLIGALMKGPVEQPGLFSLAAYPQGDAND